MTRRRRATTSGGAPHGTKSLPELILLAVSLHKAGETARAEAMYRDVLRASPRNPDALQFLSLILHSRGASREAADMLRRAAASDSQNPSIWNNLGNVLVELGDAENAAQAYEQAIAVAPDFAAPHSNLGTIHRTRGDLAAAEACCRRALEADAGLVEAWQNLSTVLVAARRFDEAVECGFKVMALAPHRASNLQPLCLAYAHLGETEKAAEIYRGWLERDPDNPLALHHLAACAGQHVPERASDRYVETVFDRFAASFDAKLSTLNYRAPELVANALKAARGAEVRGLRILDAGCGTGLCGQLVRRHALELSGVDLSAAMLERASRTGAYDALAKGELTAYLAARPGVFDVVLSADTICYFGALDGFARVAAAALAPGGCLLFTVEAALEDSDTAPGYRLQVNGRYAHHGGYVDQVLEAAGLDVLRRDSDMLRLECGLPVAGWVVTAARRDANDMPLRQA